MAGFAAYAGKVRLFVRQPIVGRMGIMATFTMPRYAVTGLSFLTSGKFMRGPVEVVYNIQTARIKYKMV